LRNRAPPNDQNANNIHSAILKKKAQEDLAVEKKKNVSRFQTLTDKK
jgi:hypothetical protein